MASILHLELPGSNIPLLSCTTWLGTVLAMLSRLGELGWAWAWSKWTDNRYRNRNQCWEFLFV